MKTSPIIVTLGGLAIILSSCNTLKSVNQPLSGDGNYDPLSSPASSKKKSTFVTSNSPAYKAGQWVETSMEAQFFRNIPKGNGKADKVLPAATPLKVVSSKGTYVKVELRSGSVGYVPQIMVIERGGGASATPANPVAPPPDLGSIPPPVEPGDIGNPELPPLPDVPGTPPPVPNLPDAPTVPELPDASTVPGTPVGGAGTPPPLPDTVPTVPEIAPPPDVPSIEPVEDAD